MQTEAKRAVERATNETISAMKKDIHTEVQKEVNKEYESIKDSVLKEINVSASKIDVARVRRDVEEAALDKFDDNLDAILENFNKSLSDTSKIYSSIRDAITRDFSSGKGFVVRLD